MIYDVTVHRLDGSRDATLLKSLHVNSQDIKATHSSRRIPARVYVYYSHAFPSPHADNRCLVQTSGRQSGHMTGCCKGPWAAVNTEELPPRGRWKIPYIYLK